MPNKHSITLKLLGCFLAIWSIAGYSELNIQITGGVEGALPIAVVPFGWKGNSPAPPVDLASIIRTDLERCGRFNVLPASKLPDKPSNPKQIKFSRWQALGEENLLIGRFQETFPNRFDTTFYLYDVFSQKRLIGYRIPSTKNDLRRMAHQISDKIYEKLTGAQGVFATHIAYVTFSRDRNNHPYIDCRLLMQTDTARAVLSHQGSQSCHQAGRQTENPSLMFLLRKDIRQFLPRISGLENVLELPLFQASMARRPGLRTGQNWL